MSLEEVAKGIGTSNQQISRLERGTQRLNTDWIYKLSNFFGVSSAVLMGDGDIPVQSQNIALQRKESSLQSGVVGVIGGNPFGPDTVPVLGNANGSSEAIMLNFDEPIGHLPRHPNQVGMKGAFALYARGDSMFPRYMPGDPVYAISNRPPAKGQDCFVEMKNGEGFIKNFVKQTDKELVCRQYNPAKEWKRHLSDVKAIHAVVGRG